MSCHTLDYVVSYFDPRLTWWRLCPNILPTIFVHGGDYVFLYFWQVLGYFWQTFRCFWQVFRCSWQVFFCWRRRLCWALRRGMSGRLFPYLYTLYIYFDTLCRFEEMFLHIRLPCTILCAVGSLCRECKYVEKRNLHVKTCITL